MEIVAFEGTNFLGKTPSVWLKVIDLVLTMWSPISGQPFMSWLFHTHFLGLFEPPKSATLRLNLRNQHIFGWFDL